MDSSSNNVKSDLWSFERDVALLKVLREKVEDFIRNISLSDKKKLRLVLCVDEAAANIVEHSCENITIDGPFIFKVEARQEVDCVKFIFRDNGVPYDPTKAPLVDIKTHIRSGKKDGLGVHIMRSNLDIFEYEYKDNMNVFSLGMLLKKET